MKVFTFTNTPNKNIPSVVNLLVRISLFIFAAIFILAVIVQGVAKVSELYLPYLITLGNSLIGLFALVIFPLSFVNKARSYLFVPTYLLSYALGGCAWMYSLLFVINVLGIWGIIFCFLFQTLTPITLLGAIFKGAWDVFGLLLGWLVCTYLIRFFSLTLNIRPNKGQREGDPNVIDVEARTKE
jgi:hypothetical protein